MTFKSMLITGMVLFSIIAFSQNLYSDTEANGVTEILTGNNETISAAPIESILSHPAVQKKQLSRNTTQAIGYRNGQQIHFIAHVRKGKLNDVWQSFYNNNQICDSGYLKMNLPDGEWKTWYRDGQLKTIRNYSAEKYHFIKVDVQRSHPKHQQYRITQYAQQRKKIAQYFQPTYEGQQQSTNTIALLGKIEHNTEGDGSSYLPPFTNSLHHGLYMNYYQNGQVKDSGYYVNGLKHGVWIESKTEDATSIGFYDHGYRSGQWKHYDVNGRLLYTDFYKRNKRVDIKHYSAE